MNDVIIKDDEIIGYSNDVLEYTKNVLIERIKNNDFEGVNPQWLEVLMSLYGDYDNELVVLRADYDEDLTIVKYQEV